MVIQAKEVEIDQFYKDLEDLLELTPKKKDVLFITGDWNEKVGSKEIPPPVCILIRHSFNYFSFPTPHWPFFTT